MIETFLRSYVLKARIAPGLILALPVLADAAYAAPVLSSWPIFSAGGVCTLALLYGLSHLVGARGVAIEPKLWDGWGGPPSTRFMRHSDTTFGAELKLSIQDALVRKFCAGLVALKEEKKDPDGADRAIVDAFRQVREYLYQHNPDGLWSKHNVEYGFCRNLLACRALWVVIALSATGFAGVYAAKTGGSIFNAASAIGFLSLLCGVYIGWAILPDAARRNAEGYAKSAWMAFLECSRINPGVTPVVGS